MNREIKFRGKRKYGTEILVGDLNFIDNKAYIFPRHETTPLNSPDWFEVDENTVGQFTGLLDKSKTEIYEGDIVKTQFKDKEPVIAIVEYDTVNPCFVMKHKYQGNKHYWYEYDFIQCGMRTNEVIGNIYENPELIPTKD